MKIGKLDVITLLCIVVLIVLIVVPLAVLFYGTIGGSWPSFSFALTPQYYIQALTSSESLVPLLNSIIVSVGGTILALVIGIAEAWFIARTNVPFKKIFGFIFIIPYFISPLITALAWDITLGDVGFLNFLLKSLFNLERAPFSLYNLPGIVWVLGLVCAPIAFLFMQSGLQSMDSSFEDASAISGGSVLQTIRRVTLPMLTPTILSSSLLIFVMEISITSVPLILGYSHRIFVLTTKIYELVEFYPPYYNLAATMSLLLLTFTVVGLYLQNRFLGGARKFFTIGGKGFRPRVINLGRMKYLALIICLLFTVMTMVLPLFGVFLASFVKSWDLKNLEFSLANYSYVFGQSTFRRSIINTFLLATLTSIIVVFFTSLLSYILIRTKVRGRLILNVISMIPVALPATVFAFALLWTWVFVPLPIYGTIWVLLIAFVAVFIPYGMRSTSASLHQIYPDLEAASLVCGGSKLYTFRKILLPLLKPSLIATWIIVFTGVIKEFSAALFLYSSGSETMSIQIYQYWFYLSFSEPAVVCVLQILLILSVIIIFQRIFKADITKVY